MCCTAGVCPGASGVVAGALFAAGNKNGEVKYSGMSRDQTRSDCIFMGHVVGTDAPGLGIYAVKLERPTFVAALVIFCRNCSPASKLTKIDGMRML